VPVGGSLGENAQGFATFKLAHGQRQCALFWCEKRLEAIEKTRLSWLACYRDHFPIMIKKPNSRHEAKIPISQEMDELSMPEEIDQSR
jgi:hypothetical protein